MKHSLPRLAALLMALGLVAAACGSADSSDTAAPAAAAPSSGEGTAPSSVLDITAPAADGSTIDLSTYAGQDLMLWFWAPW